MEHYISKTCLDGEWRLYIAENKDCKDYADLIATEKQLKKNRLSSISGTVPGNFELDLQRAGKLGDIFFDADILNMQRMENYHLWYVREFEFCGNTEGKTLRFDGIDTVATIYLNGQCVYFADNMFLTHEFPVDYELKQGKNELLVHIIPATLHARQTEKVGAGITASQPYNFGSLRVRKAAHMYGWDIMPRIISGGIWKSVYLCEEKSECINNVYLYTLKNNPNHNLIKLYYDLTLKGDYSTDYTLLVEGVCGDSKFSVSDKVWHTEGRLEGEISPPKLWWPRNMGEQNLYDITIKLMKGNKVLDTKTFRHGFRTVELIKSDYIDKDGKGDFKFLVNGKPFFVFGTNWVPLDPLHSRDKERLNKALQLLLDSGSNFVRCWGGNVYESQEFYNFCDEHGIAVWQDFAMGCSVYPQDEAFQNVLKEEALEIIKRYRQHAALFLWAGDNEVDIFVAGHRNPNKNILTRKVLAEACEQEDPIRPYIPSSPYISQKAYDDNMTDNIPENHLWGPRRYYKEDFYENAVCRFVSETGYHGCNSPKSIKKFIREENLWPWKDNKAWFAHATSMQVDPEDCYGYRIPLMASHLNVLFGNTVPDNLEDFAKASQISQSEANKYFIERFRTGKINWERTGIIWWNLLDGWPQFSDSVVDYYYCRKLSYFTIKRLQEPICAMFRDPTKHEGKLELIGVNEFPHDKDISFKVTNLENDEIVLEGIGTIGENAATVLGGIDAITNQTCLLITYTVDGKEHKNHYLTGTPTYDYKKVYKWLEKADLLTFEGF